MLSVIWILEIEKSNYIYWFAIHVAYSKLACSVNQTSQ